MPKPAKPDKELPEVLRADEVAELLRLSVDLVYEAAGNGTLPHRRIGRRLLFSRVAVLEWMRGTSVVRKH